MRVLFVLKAVGQVLFFYGLLAWVYGVTVQVTHPEWLTLPLSHLTLWLRVDTFTIISFFVSAAGLLLWRIATEDGKK